MRILTNSAIAAVLLLTVAACSNPPAQPSLSNVTAPPPTTPGPATTPRPYIAPSAKPSPTASSSASTTISGTSLRSELTKAGFTCQVSSDFNSCAGSNSSSGDTYGVSFWAASDSVSVLTLVAAGPKDGSMDKPGAATYLGAVYNLSLGASDGAARITASFSKPGLSWEQGLWVSTVAAADANGIEIDAGLRVDKAGRALLSGKTLSSALSNNGFTCGPAQDNGGSKTYQCDLLSTSVSYTNDLEGSFFSASITAAKTDDFMVVINLLFMPQDALAFKTWLTARTNGQENFGIYQASLLSTSSGFKLSIE